MTVRLDPLTETLRTRIVGGEYAPGARLPLREELIAATGASSATLQQAVHRLADDGFLRTRGRLGTFVAERPPHLYRFGLVFSFAPLDPPSLHEESLLRLCEAERADGRWFVPYRPVQPGGDAAELDRLVDDVERRRLAGLLFVQRPLAAWAETPILQAPDLPRVMLVMHPFSIPGVTPLVHRQEDWFRRALARVRDAGCTRAAVLSAGRPPPAGADPVRAAADAAGLVCPPEWRHGILRENQPLARSLARLLASGADRPEAIVVTDDNLAGAVAAGLDDAGVPDDGVLLVCHANFPHLPPVRRPVTWLGTDLLAIWETALALMEQQRAGAPAPPHIVPPRFAEEASTRSVPVPLPEEA